MLRRSARGFTLLEMMVALAIVALIVMMGLPSYSIWLQNVQIRNAAESIYDGLSAARAEAVKRDDLVQFALSAQSGWSVSLVSSGQTLQSHSSADGSRNASVALTPASSLTVTFNSVGVVVPNNDGSPSVARVDVTSGVSTDPSIRPLAVIVGAGGFLRLCDPALPSGDPRACS